VAEDLKGYGAITQPTSAGGFGFDAQWDGFGYTMTSVLVPFSDDGRDMGAIEYAVRGGFDRLLWTENHDSVGNGGARFPVRVDGANPESFAARRRSMLAAALMLTAPGVPMLFMGQDALATSGFSDPPRTLASPTPVGTKVRAFYKDLIALRRNAAGGTAGLAEPKVDILHRNDANKVIAYRRNGPSNEEVIVIINLRNRAYTRYDIGVPASGTWRVRLDSDWKAYGDDFGGGTTAPITTLAKTTDGRPYTLPVALAAYGILVLSH
jgi:1,4-alpha-glucan branching enzyme